MARSVGAARANDKGVDDDGGEDNRVDDGGGDIAGHIGGGADEEAAGTAAPAVGVLADLSATTSAADSPIGPDSALTPPAPAADPPPAEAADADTDADAEPVEPVEPASAGRITFVGESMPSADRLSGDSVAPASVVVGASTGGSSA